MDEIKFQKSAIVIYQECPVLSEDVSLETLKKRFVTYVKISRIVSFFLPFFIYNYWRLKWWKRTLSMVKPFMIRFRVNQRNATEIMVEKHRLYGGGSLLDVGTLGVAVRNLDKVYRLSNIIEYPRLQKTQLYQEESLKDTVMDMGNYCVLAIMICRGEIVR